MRRLLAAPRFAAPAANDTATSARDPRIARALDAIAAHPSHRWTVATLAKIAGASRAAFARRFAAEVGVPPMRHVAAIRLRIAAEQLTESDAPLADVATAVGYATEFALSRAFRRFIGVPPGTYRRRLRESGSSSAPRCLAA